MVSPISKSLFRRSEDPQETQRIVLAAAVNGNPICRAELPTLLSAFDGSLRLVAETVVSMQEQGQFIDRHTLRARLEQNRLLRSGRLGTVSTAEQLMGELFASAYQPRQPEAYVDVLKQQLETRRQEEFRTNLTATVHTYADEPERLLGELQSMVAEYQSRRGHGTVDRAQSEILQLIPFLQRLEKRQQGVSFQGLDSGFQHVNHLCNGLDTGLFILAAPPGEGKTTLVWQMCCQTAKANQVPVIFVSMEQSADELRIKALSRMARVDYRHLLRGRFQQNDSDENWSKVLHAAAEYAEIAPHLAIIEGDQTTTVDAIRNKVAQIQREAGVGRCLIAIDYLQCLPADREDASVVTNTKDRIDLHVTKLRRLARDLNASILCISSENRAGYKSKGLDVYKESGGIEYAADIAAVLTRDKEESQKGNGQYRVENLNIIKNRNGERGVVKFKFYAARAEFVETGKGELTQGDDE